MRFWMLLAVFLVASAARADADAGDGADEWGAFSQNASALETATPANCLTACNALESLARAANHICQVAPEHCREAKARLAAARERVRAACPECAMGFAGDEQRGSVVVARESAPQRGGCAGCATSSPAAGARGALFALAMLLLLARIRRR